MDDVATEGSGVARGRGGPRGRSGSASGARRGRRSSSRLGHWTYADAPSAAWVKRSLSVVLGRARGSGRGGPAVSLCELVRPRYGPPPRRTSTERRIRARPTYVSRARRRPTRPRRFAHHLPGRVAAGQNVDVGDRISSSSMVGRDAELGIVEAALTAAERGRPSLTVLAGEAGVGKTRLLRDVTRLALERGHLVLWG